MTARVKEFLRVLGDLSKYALRFNLFRSRRVGCGSGERPYLVREAKQISPAMPVTDAKLLASVAL